MFFLSCSDEEDSETERICIIRDTVVVTDTVVVIDEETAHKIYLDSLWSKGLVVYPEGPFKTISSAVAIAPDSTTIYVLPGTYCEAVKAWGKTLNIIGTDSAKCILYNATGNYYTPPIEMSSGRLQGFTIMAQKNDTLSSSVIADYCLHIEDNYCYGHSFEVKSVRFIGETSTVVGCGTRGNYSLSFINCTFESMTTHPCTYIHDCIEDKYTGHADVLYKNCFFKTVNNVQPLYFKSHLEGNTTTVTFIGNKFDCPVLATSTQPVSVTNAIEGTYDGWLGMMNWYLGSESSGNEISLLNY